MTLTGILAAPAAPPDVVFALPDRFWTAFSDHRQSLRGEAAWR